MLPLVDLDPDAGESFHPAGTSMMADCGLSVCDERRFAGMEGSTWTCGRAVAGGVDPDMMSFGYGLCASAVHR
jgi:hypothetical protein